MYHTRTWLTPNKFSTGAVICYHDANCVREDLRAFVQIKDCSDTFWININGLNELASFISFVNNLEKIINKKSGTFYCFRKYKVKCIRVKLSNDSLNFFNKPHIINKTIIRLHADGETCADHDEFLDKLNILLTDLKLFKDYLIENKQKLFVKRKA